MGAGGRALPQARALAGLGAVVLAIGPLAGGGEARTSSVPTARLAEVRVGAHPGFDRIVFQFSGALPANRSVTWVRQVTQDASGKPLSLGGKAFLRMVFSPAVAHTSAGVPTWTGPVPGRFDYPVLRSLRLAGDFEGVVSFGAGLWQKVPLRVSTLTGPPRVVIDAQVPAGGPAALGPADNGRLVYLAVGRKVVLSLKTCVDCGYSWHARSLPDPTVVRASGPALVPLPHPSGAVGFPYETRWVLRATGQGMASMHLYETGPQRGAPPVASYSLRFLVR